MTKSEYQKLVEFIAPKFDRFELEFEKIDKRFDGVDKRFDGIETRLTKVEISFEENRHLIETVAEGVSGLRTEMHTGFASLREEMRTGFQLHGNAIRALNTRVTRLEERAG